MRGDGGGTTSTVKVVKYGRGPYGRGRAGRVPWRWPGVAVLPKRSGKGAARTEARRVRGSYWLKSWSELQGEGFWSD